MKVERKNKGFEPVVITLESQEEVDVLYTLTGDVKGLGYVRDITDEIHYGLQEYAVYDPDMFSRDDISIKVN